MKDALKRILGISPAPAQAETQKKEDVVMDGQGTGAATDAVVDTNADMASLTASFATLTAQFNAQAEKVAELEKALADAATFKATAEADKAAATLAARKVKVVAAIGDEKATALMDVLGTMTDPAFDAVMTAMSAAQVKEAETPAFQEVGVDGKADLAKVEADVESNPTMDYLLSKYPPKK